MPKQMLNRSSRRWDLQRTAIGRIDILVQWGPVVLQKMVILQSALRLSSRNLCAGLC